MIFEVMEKENNRKTILAKNEAVQSERVGFSANVKFMLLLAFSSLVVYVNTLKNGFVFDDFTLITENTIVQKGIAAIPEILSTPYRKGYAATVNDLYRPMSLVVFATVYQCFEKNPLPYHLVNILLFAGCVLLLFLFLDRLFERKKTEVMFVAALLFALHPIHTEVVANIKSCDELLCFLFGFASLNLFVRYSETGKIMDLLLGAACFFLSLLSKETSISFLIVVPMVFFFYKDSSRKRCGYITIAVAIVAACYLFIRFSVLAHYHANDSTNISIIENALVSPGLSYSSRIATAILVLGYYIKLLFIPYPLICDYSYDSIPFVTFSDPGALLSLLVYCLLIFFGITRLLKNHKDPYAFGILFYLVTISLFSNVVFLIGTTMGERLVFFASVGFCITIAFMLARLTENTAKAKLLRSKKVLAVLIPMVVIFSVITIDRNGDWLTNHTLFTADIKKQPQSSRLNFNLGSELARTTSSGEGPEKVRELRQQGIDYLNASVALYPPDEPAHNALCNAYFRNGQYDSAEIHGEIAYRLNPHITSTINTLAGIYFIKKDYINAIRFCKQAIQLEPAIVQPYVNISLCYISLNKVDSAIYFLKKVIAIDPAQQMAYERLAQSYTALGKMDSASMYEAIAKQIQVNTHN